MALSDDGSRRFTDREVAVVLRRAAEIDESEGSGAGGGMSLADLRQIAGEVGISPDAIDRAVGGLEHGRAPGSGWAGAPLVRRSVRAVPGRLGRDAVARLVRIVDEEADHAGAVSEALGSVRWTSSDRLRSSMVSIGQVGDETRIEVVEKASPRLRRLMHFLPAAWGLMLAGPVMGAMGPGAGAVAAGAGALGLLVGAALGRVAWTLVSAQSARRVDRLTASLTRAATSEATPEGRGDEDPGRH